MEDLIYRVILAGVGVAIIAGILGCFVIWKRMSYFSESISHSALLGVALGVASGFGLQSGLLITAVIFAVIIAYMQNQDYFSNDAILGIFSHIALSLGVIVLSLQGDRTDYFSLLFGDILSVNQGDIVWIYAILISIVSIMIIFWDKLLFVTLNACLAKAEGIQTFIFQTLIMIMIAMTVSVSVQIVGVLLITSMLLIPPAIGRVFSDAPLKMMIFSAFFAILAVIIGVIISLNYDIATGPAIVVVLGVLFIFSQLFRQDN
ncbi:MAG: metal ABC transporter permease [Gammaproteobacteria bacterium]|jgi:zinc transport system permease protein